MKKTKLVLLAALFAWITCGPTLAGPVVMYGGLGGHAAGGGSTNDGALVTVDQATADITLVGHPAGVAKLTGIAFDTDGSLFGSTLGAIPFPPPPSPSTSTLIRINPDSGALISTVGPIVDGPNGPAISMADLAMQPGTDVLFGIRSEIDGLGGAGKLYTINKASGVATLVGNTGHMFGSIAFAPTGTLYLSAADLGATGPTNASLKTLNPANAAIVSSVPTANFFGALGVRPTDGVIFGGDGDNGTIVTVNAVTGAETLLSGTTGQNFVGDLDFRVVPEPAMLGVVAIGTAVMLVRPRRRHHCVCAAPADCDSRLDRHFAEPPPTPRRPEDAAA
jgi:hypothetical protein